MFGFGNNKEEHSDFDSLFMECNDLLYNLGLRLFKGSEDEAMDLLHDTYLRAKDSYHSYQGRAKFSTWLYAIATNLGLNKIKSSGKFAALKDPYPNNQSWIENILDETQQSSSENLIAQEQQQHLQTELDKLPEAYRIPLVLFYYEGMSYKDIAEHLGEKEGTIKSYLFRGKAILRKNIKYE